MSYVLTVLADAPRHYWRLTDPGGGLLHDIGAAAQRALTLVGSSTLPYTGPASDGGSAWFDANAGAWHVSGDTVKSPFSCEGWVWLHALVGAARGLFGHYANVQTTAANTILFASGGPNVTSPAVLTEQAWHHVVGTYGPAGGAKLWIDGVNVALAAYGAAWGPFAQVPAVGMFAAGTNFCSANIAEVATYDIELSPARISSHYLAADNLGSRPVFRTSGTPGANGSVVTVPEQLTALVGDVTKNLGNAP